MKRILRKIIPQKIINIFWHLPWAVYANIKYGFPSKKIRVIGVTGTDGKTTTTNMIFHILRESGKKVSMVSTINAYIGDKSYDTGFHVTSPDPLDVQKYLKMAVKAGSEYIIMETTSHGLDQYRFWGVNFEIGVITNITHEHLDYHKTWENYFSAKAKLIKKVKLAILNRQEKHFNKLSNRTSGKVISFGFSKLADYNPRKFPLKLSLPGDFNMLNALAASAVAINLGIESKKIKGALLSFKSLIGRMQSIENDKGVKIIIDFAHTPNALKNALETLRQESKGGKLISVFGCAGQRDIEKRSLMGEISVRLADFTVITAEDPRGLIEEINQQIMEGAKKAGGELQKNIYIENDRQKAIYFAINNLSKKGDIVGIFGKGHENSLNLDGKKEIPWSDNEAVLKSINNG